MFFCFFLLFRATSNIQLDLPADVFCVANIMPISCNIMITYIQLHKYYNYYYNFNNGQSQWNIEFGGILTVV